MISGNDVSLQGSSSSSIASYLSTETLGTSSLNLYDVNNNPYNISSFGHNSVLSSFKSTLTNSYLSAIINSYNSTISNSTFSSIISSDNTNSILNSDTTIILASQGSNIRISQTANSEAIAVIASQGVNLNLESGYSSFIAGSEGVNIDGSGQVFSILCSEGVNITSGSMYQTMITSSMGLNIGGSNNPYISGSIIAGQSLTLTESINSSIIAIQSGTFNCGIQDSIIVGSGMNSANYYNTGYAIEYMAMFGGGHTVDIQSYASLMFGEGCYLEGQYSLIGGNNCKVYGNNNSNLVIGEGHVVGIEGEQLYTYGSVVLGSEGNRISSNYPGAGMWDNKIFGQQCSIIATSQNYGQLYNNVIIGGEGATIKGNGFLNILAGGENNIDTTRETYVGFNDYQGNYFSIVGTQITMGGNIQNCGIFAGESCNITEGSECTIVGGIGNNIGFVSTTGTANSYPAYGSSIIGGESNSILGYSGLANNSIVVGGESNLILARYGYINSSGVFGGQTNIVLNDCSYIIGANSSIIQNSTNSSSLFNIILGGQNNVITGTNTTLIGSYLIGQYNNQLIIGQYNNNDTNNSFEIGGGSNISGTITKKNIFWVKNDGTMGTASYVTNGINTPSLGSNCPATTSSTPYAWIKLALSDGSIVYMPAWK